MFSPFGAQLVPVPQSAMALAKGAFVGAGGAKNMTFEDLPVEMPPAEALRGAVCARATSLCLCLPPFSLLSSFFLRYRGPWKATGTSSFKPIRETITPETVGLNLMRVASL